MSGTWGDPAADLVDETRRVLLSLRGVWDEEAVDEWDHALQCADHARRSPRGHDATFVVAALLHDVAHSPLLDAAGRPHELVARDWLTARFGARVGWLAGAHVAAKRHLADAEPGYTGTLSGTSVRTLARQGGHGGVGPEWTTHPWWPDALALRRCDDRAKCPGAAAPGLDWALDQVRRAVAR